MKQLIIGQCLLILTCIFYLFFWYLGYRPGTSVNRGQGVTGFFLLMIVISGIAGITLSLKATEATRQLAISQLFIIIGGIAAYIILMLITKYGFDRFVTTELFLIVGWTMLEASILNRLAGSGILFGAKLICMIGVIAFAFVISMVLYVAYYRMEDMKAFYAAMVPLITEGVSMSVLVLMLFSVK